MTRQKLPPKWLVGPLARQTLDTVTAAQWRRATRMQRAAFWEFWHMSGMVAFACLTCHFPTERGVAYCEACTPADMERATRMVDRLFSSTARNRRAYWAWLKQGGTL